MSRLQKENKCARFILMHMNTQTMDDLKLVYLDPSSEMEIKSWLTYFDCICSKVKKDL